MGPLGGLPLQSICCIFRSFLVSAPIMDIIPRSREYKMCMCTRGEEEGQEIQRSLFQNTTKIRALPSIPPIQTGKRTDINCQVRVGWESRKLQNLNPIH